MRALSPDAGPVTKKNDTPVIAGVTADDVDQRTRLKALFSSLVGGVVEWYDYFLYGTMAGIIIGRCDQLK